MRKAQKKEVLEMIQTLHEAHDEVKGYIDKKNYALAQDILSQCQECAISIGTAIEKIEGEGFITVSYVESYCDVLFSIYEELNGSDVNANKAYKNLKKQLLRIENSVKNDVPVRKEIAFFPYKASMWDSLESVYLAAKEDPDCDVYCVPIPYYDRNPDRSLGQMHYEGREYPKNIEVIDWQTYNFEERKPDVVYIHNPYDDWNLVTCVHPRFFSANLKKYTEELVYIPYFVLNEIEPENQAGIDGMKHFCFLPGVVNADKVILQSEKMKQIYVNEYLKAAQAHGLGGYHLDRKKLEEKFLGLGSPKFDKVKNTKKEYLEIPQEWLKIIEKPDGSWKKIIFYNTSIGALLEHNEKMLEKMKDVFQVFKENKDEVALLWRPHPLIKSTVSSMRPQLWMEYERLVNQYRQEGWGIYDDTADMDRAVVLSDKYYGDLSSVVHLYKACNKPTLIQDVGRLSNHETKINTQVETGVVIEEKIYYTIPRYNKFYCTDLKSGHTECIKNTEGRRKGEADRYNHATLIKGDIYFLSDETYEYAILNMKTHEVKEGRLECCITEKIMYLGKYQNRIYLIAQDADKLLWIEEDRVCEEELKEDIICSTKGIFWFFEKENSILWKVDVVNKMKERITFLTNEILEGNNNFSFVFAVDKKLIFIPCLTNIILIVDLSEKSIQKVKLPISTTCFLGGIGALRYIEGSGEDKFLSSMFSSEIYSWKKDLLSEIGKVAIGVDDISFQELYNDLIENKLFVELYMDLSVYISL